MEQTIKKFKTDEVESGIIKLFILVYESDPGKKLISKWKFKRKQYSVYIKE